MAGARRARAASWLFVLAGCALTPQEESAAAVDFVAAHYARIGVGTDWTRVQADFWPEARITRALAGQPGALESISVAEYFAGTAPRIDAMAAFSITPLGIHALVYDRVATVWAHVRVESTAADGSRSAFAAVDVFTLARDAGESWRIHGLLWQGVAEGWPPACDRRARPFTAGGFETRLGFGYSHP